MLFSKLYAMLAGVVSLLAFSKAAAESMYFFEQLEDGEQVDLFSHGPFSLTAECSTIEGEPNARIWLTIDAATRDEWVYGMPDFSPQDWMGSCVGAYQKGTSETCVVYWAGAGSGSHGVAFQSLSGYYVSMEKDTTIAFNKVYDGYPYHEYYSYDFAAFPEEYTCAISGFINYATA